MAGKTRVAKYQADRTNQKLYFCRLACQAAGDSTDKQLYQAHCETAIFHLYGTYLAFLQELGHFYGLNMSAPTMVDIEQALSARTQVSPNLQPQIKGWLRSEALWLWFFLIICLCLI